MVVGAMVVALTAAQTLVSQSSFRLQELERQAAELEGEYGSLRLRAAHLSSPKRIAAAAERSGLILPERVEVLVVPGPGRPGQRPGHAGLPGRTFALKGDGGGGG
jgi:cell division protein FtsL